ncbi:hypothetical protein CEP52_012693 [Fusarium oligoseptatum]|uniref:Uncharacterized protein n=1 Tax=Fusarium oligoseptatum TaxID=2604345 RepID=A0A428SX56_9HYPO|nr:hypothetical protein CEP52_012693 [Fusarium oligoseptatum]
MASFSDKVVAITGAASRIGFEISKILITKGAILSISYIQAAALQSTTSQLKELGGPDAKALALRVDVTKRSEVDAWIQRTVAEFGGLHCAANFAVRQTDGPGSQRDHHSVQPQTQHDPSSRQDSRARIREANGGTEKSNNDLPLRLKNLVPRRRPGAAISPTLPTNCGSPHSSSSNDFVLRDKVTENLH